MTFYQDVVNYLGVIITKILGKNQSIRCVIGRQRMKKKKEVKWKE